jgi:hypothetical protein
MGRTPGHPWVGESVPLDWANAYTGPELALDGAALRFRVRRDLADSPVLEAGDSFIAGFYESNVMLSGDAVEASFVVVCDGAGSIRLSGGTDPDWSLDDPADASVPMGTHTVSGPTVVVGDPFPTFDVDAYLAQVEETIVFVECLSGDVEVNQVKLRLWPPGGPVGDWIDAPGFDVVAPPQARLADVGDAFGTVNEVPNFLTGSDPAVVFAAAANEMVNDAADADKMQAVGQLDTPTIQASIIAKVVVGEDSDTPGVFTATSEGGPTGTLVQQPDPIETTRIETSSLGSLGEYGVDVTWPPDEVPGDLGVDIPTPPTVEWGAYTVTTSELTISPDGSGGNATMHVMAVADDAFVDPSSVTFPAFAGIDVPPLSSSTSLTMPDARTILVSLTHLYLVDAPIYGGTAGAWNVGTVATISAPLVDSTVHIPNYRYWSPSAVATVRRVLRQLHRDDGQGIAPRRAYGGASRTHTRRAYGYD